MLLSGNPLKIAQAIVHECIHTYLRLKTHNSTIGIPIPLLTLNNMTLSQLINSQYNAFSGPQDQHSFMFNHLVPTLSQIFLELKDLLINTSNQSYLENDSPVNYPVTSGLASTQFNWIEFFDNVSMVGLQDCTAFQNAIGTINAGNFTTVNNLVKSIKHTHYVNCLQLISIDF